MPTCLLFCWMDVCTYSKHSLCIWNSNVTEHSVLSSFSLNLTALREEDPEVEVLGEEVGRSCKNRSGIRQKWSRCPRGEGPRCFSSRIYQLLLTAAGPNHPCVGNLSWGWADPCHPLPYSIPREIPAGMPEKNFEGRKYWVQMPSLLLTSFVIGGKLLTLVVPNPFGTGRTGRQFFHGWRGGGGFRW